MPTDGRYRSDVVTTDRGTDAVSVAETMRTRNVGSTVVTEGQVPVGIVTLGGRSERPEAERHHSAEATKQQRRPYVDRYRSP